MLNNNIFARSSMIARVVEIENEHMFECTLFDIVGRMEKNLR